MPAEERRRTAEMLFLGDVASLERGNAELVIVETFVRSSVRCAARRVLLQEVVQAFDHETYVRSNRFDFDAQLCLEFVELLIDLLEPSIDLLEPMIDLLEPLIDLLEPLIDSLEPLIDSLEPSIDLCELQVDRSAEGSQLGAQRVQRFRCLVHPRRSQVYHRHPSTNRAR